MPDIDNERLIQAALAAALDVVASVSAANLRKNGPLLPATKVDPHAIRALAHVLDQLAPGAIENARAEYQKNLTAARDKYFEERGWVAPNLAAGS